MSDSFTPVIGTSRGIALKSIGSRSPWPHLKISVPKQKLLAEICGREDGHGSTCVLHLENEGFPGARLLGLGWKPDYLLRVCLDSGPGPDGLPEIYKEPLATWLAELGFTPEVP